MALTKQVAVSYAADGIRCNAMCPGPILTPILEPFFAEPGVREQFEQRIPLGRMGQPERRCKSRSVPCLDESSFITGALIVIDGGSLRRDRGAGDAGRPGPAPSADAVPGPSGYEDAVFLAIPRELAGLGAATDRRRPREPRAAPPAAAGDAPSLMLMAHMDQVGLFVKYIDRGGFLYCERIGLVDERTLARVADRALDRRGPRARRRRRSQPPPRERDRALARPADRRALGRMSARARAAEVAALGIEIGQPATLHGEPVARGRTPGRQPVDRQPGRLRGARRAGRRRGRARARHRARSSSGAPRRRSARAAPGSRRRWLATDDRGRRRHAARRRPVDSGPRTRRARSAPAPSSARTTTAAASGRSTTPHQASAARARARDGSRTSSTSSRPGRTPARSSSPDEGPRPAASTSRGSAATRRRVPRPARPRAHRRAPRRLRPARMRPTAARARRATGVPARLHEVAARPLVSGRLEGKVALVTGGAVGIGRFDRPAVRRAKAVPSASLDLDGRRRARVRRGDLGRRRVGARASRPTSRAARGFRLRAVAVARGGLRWARRRW